MLCTWPLGPRFRGDERRGYTDPPQLRFGAMNSRPADRLSIAVAQANPTVGDIAGNADKARHARRVAASDGADVVVFSELFICGYPP